MRYAIVFSIVVGLAMATPTPPPELKARMGVCISERGRGCFEGNPCCEGLTCFGDSWRDYDERGYCAKRSNEEIQQEKQDEECKDDDPILCGEGMRWKRDPQFKDEGIRFKRDPQFKDEGIRF